MKIQVNKKHYDFMKYNHIKRWSSYWYQIKEILELNPKSVLEVGPGSGIIGYILKQQEITYKTIDFAKYLRPDYIGDVRNFNLNKKFDLVMACQVLEHMPYKYFIKSLKNMEKHSNKDIIISLPYFGPFIKFEFLLYPIIKINYLKKIFFPKKLEFDGEHYWEIGRKNYSLKKITIDLENNFIVKKQFLVKENPYHYFFILEKKNKK